ncbi:MAG: hypothetical protein WC627_02475 [Legionella sp.]|jgi:hypothetical protein
MPFTLILQGTDTKYTPNTTEDYPKGELLSLIANLIAGCNLQLKTHNDAQLNSVEYIYNNDLVLIEGPETLGSNVGDRIARGVLNVLEALSRGETEICIMAHSRGAIEALLIAHELERIKQLILTNTCGDEALINSVCPRTKLAMKLRDKEFSALKDSIQNIDKLSLAIFNIDPVPGGSVLGIPIAYWFDERFYTVPALVKEYVQIVYANERTRGFKVVIPAATSPKTSVSLIRYPGHHGTGSGNFKDQQKNLVPETIANRETKHLQQLLILKIIDFLRRNHYQLPIDLSLIPIDSELKPLISAFMQDAAGARNTYLELYQEIVKNRLAYEHFNKTYYPLLNQEQALQGLVMSITNDRIVYNKQQKDYFLADVLPPFPGTEFLDEDHARLYLNKEMGFNKDLPLAELILGAVTFLINLAKQEYLISDSAMSFELLDMNKYYSDESQDVYFYESLVNNDKVRALILEAVAVLLAKFRRCYLDDAQDLDVLIKAMCTSIEMCVREGQSKLIKTVLTLIKQELALALTNKSDQLIRQAQITSRMLIQDQQDEKVLVSDLIQIHNTLTHFLLSINQFKNLDLNLDFEHLIDSIESAKVLLVDRIAQYVLVKKVDVSSVIKPLFNPSNMALYNKIVHLAIGMGGIIIKTQDVGVGEGIKTQDVGVGERIETQDVGVGERIETQDVGVGAGIETQDVGVGAGIETQDVGVGAGIKTQDVGVGAGIKTQDVGVGAGIETQDVAVGVDDVNIYVPRLVRGIQPDLNIEHEGSTNSQDLDPADKPRDIEVSVSTDIETQDVGVGEGIETHDVGVGTGIETRDIGIGSQDIESTTNQTLSLAEQKSNILIQEQLIPLTKNYLKHLYLEAKNTLKKSGVALNTNQQARLPTFKNKLKNPTEYNKILNKHRIVFNLLQNLTDSTKVPLPSARINLFAQALELNDAKSKINKHRDADWVRYSKNCFVVLSLLITGLVPGLIALGAYSIYTNKSPLLFFQSQGGQYTDELDTLLPTVQLK